MKNQLKNEVKLMMLTNHENIVKYETHFEDQEYIFLILDLAEEGKINFFKIRFFFTAYHF